MWALAAKAEAEETTEDVVAGRCDAAALADEEEIEVEEE